MRYSVLCVLIALAVATGSTLVPAPADAATSPVRIKKIPTRWIGWDGKAVIKPLVKKSKNVQIITKSIAVRRDGNVLRKDRKAVALKSGTYRVKTKVVYRSKGKKRTMAAAQWVVVKQGRCAIKADYRSINARAAASAGDTITTASRLLHQRGQLMSRYLGPVTLGDMRDMAGEVGWAYDALIEQYGEDALLDMGTYRVCQNNQMEVNVMYIDGHAIVKEAL